MICKVCGIEFQSTFVLNTICSKKCKNKLYWETHKSEYHEPRKRQEGSIKIVDAPLEYKDYVGMEYNSLEYQSSLYMGTFPEGIILERDGKRYKIHGEPTPIDFALRGLGYNHQKAVSVR